MQRIASENMIDGQLEPNQILSPLLLDAMRSVPREQFVPQSYQHTAYADKAIPLGKQRYMLSPQSLGSLLQSAAVLPGLKVLLVGANTGYAAALLNHCDCEVYALEESQDLANKARQNLRAVGLEDVHVHTFSHSSGYAQHAPFDRIIVEGMDEGLADALEPQLAEDGVMVYLQKRVHVSDDLPAIAQIIRRVKQDGQCYEETLIDVFSYALTPHKDKQEFEF